MPEPQISSQQPNSGALAGPVSRVAVPATEGKPHMRQHEWYWGDGRPCCVNCGTFTDCTEQKNVLARAIDAEAERDDLRAALIWAMTNVDDPDEHDGEYAEDHAGATRLAWPDNPENWS